LQKTKIKDAVAFHEESMERQAAMSRFRAEAAKGFRKAVLGYDFG
jgi:hypothetical protein